MRGMLRLSLGSCVLAGLVLVSPAGAQSGNLLTNSSFETDTLASGVSNTYGLWQADLGDIVGTAGSIVPPDGSQMLKFLYSGWSGPSGAGGSQIEQAVDISAYSDLIQTGTAVARGSALFNRIVGDSQTDTRFGVKLLAFNCDPSAYATKREAGEFEYVFFDLFSDADPATWEVVEAEMPLPADTTFIALQLQAIEDVYNDSHGTEFDGHYADRAYLTIVPEPATLGLLALGGLAMLRLRRGKNANERGGQVGA